MHFGFISPVVSDVKHLFVCLSPLTFLEKYPSKFFVKFNQAVSLVLSYRFFMNCFVFLGINPLRDTGLHTFSSISLIAFDSLDYDLR